jgi:hypothetical protein
LKIEGITYTYWVKDVGNVLAHSVNPYLKQGSADSISKMYKFADVIFGADHGQGSVVKRPFVRMDARYERNTLSISDHIW